MEKSTRAIISTEVDEGDECGGGSEDWKPARGPWPRVTAVEAARVEGELQDPPAPGARTTCSAYSGKSSL